MAAASRFDYVFEVFKLIIRKICCIYCPTTKTIIPIIMIIVKYIYILQLFINIFAFEIPYRLYIGRVLYLTAQAFIGRRPILETGLCFDLRKMDYQYNQ